MAIFIGPKLTNASGGNFNISNGYKIHSFTSSGSFTPTENGTVEVLVVGGGGGSDDGDNSGGGGGSVLYRKFQSVTGGTPYPITVGDAGFGAIRTSTEYSSSGTYTTPSTAQNIEFLLVGGGGAGNRYPSGGGGGGAGSVLYKKFHPVATSTGYAFTIGAGGPHPLGPGYCGGKGGNSTAFGLTAYGGGGGRGVNDTGNDCGNNPQGSGGGGGWSSPGALGASVLGYGYPGGDADTGPGGGGGGAGGAGNPRSNGATGGDGIDISISGAPVEYGRGGPSTPVTDPDFDNSVYGTGGRAQASGTGGVLIVREVKSTSGGTSSAFGIDAPGGAAASRGNPAGSGGGENSGAGTVASSGYGITTGNGQIYYGFPGGSAVGSLGGGGGGAGATATGAVGGNGVTFSITGSSVNYGHGGPAPGTSDPGYDVSIYGSGGSSTAGASGTVIIRYSA